MRILFAFIFITSICFCNFTHAGNGAAPDSSIRTFSPTSINCSKIGAVDTIIYEAIDIGAPTYNLKNYLGCYRIYEGASYKIIYMYGSQCARIKEILQTAIEKSYGNYSDSDKAWIMRMAFDEILGVETKTK